MAAPKYPPSQHADQQANNHRVLNRRCHRVLVYPERYDKEYAGINEPGQEAVARLGDLALGSLFC